MSVSRKYRFYAQARQLSHNADKPPISAGKIPPRYCGCFLINMAQRKFWQAALDVCFPTRCMACGQQTRQGAWCDACFAALPRIEKSCARCAMPLPTTADMLCGACLRHPPPFDATVAACRYTFPLDRLLQDFKYGHRLALAVPLAQLLLDAFRKNKGGASSEAPTCVLAMPLSAKRQIERGFNQAQELAHPVAEALKLPLLTDAVDLSCLYEMADALTQQGMV